MKFELPQLPCAYDALEPHIDARTMELHHAKHHQTYTAKLNEALEKHPDFSAPSIEDLLKSLNYVPEDIRVAVQNYGGGYFNHSFFWKVMAPPARGRENAPTGEFAEAITRAFGGFNAFKERFAKAAAGFFGSGWTWLVKSPAGELSIVSTSN